MKKSGTWFSFGETQLVQGITDAAAFLEKNKEIAQRIEHEIRQKSGLIREAISEKGASTPESAKSAAKRERAKAKVGREINLTAEPSGSPSGASIS